MLGAVPRTFVWTAQSEEHLSGQLGVGGASAWTARDGRWGAAAWRMHSGTELDGSTGSLLVVNFHVAVIFLRAQGFNVCINKLTHKTRAGGGDKGIWVRPVFPKLFHFQPPRDFFRPFFQSSSKIKWVPQWLWNRKCVYMHIYAAYLHCVLVQQQQKMVWTIINFLPPLRAGEYIHRKDPQDSSWLRNQRRGACYMGTVTLVYWVTLSSKPYLLFGHPKSLSKLGKYSVVWNVPT